MHLLNWHRADFHKSSQISVASITYTDLATWLLLGTKWTTDKNKKQEQGYVVRFPDGLIEVTRGYLVRFPPIPEIELIPQVEL